MEAEESWENHESLFRKVWEHTSDALALSDAEGIVLAANPAYLALYGYSAQDVIGKSFAVIFPEEVRTQAIEQYKAVFAGDVTPATFESTVVCADGTTRIVEASATFLTSAGTRTAMLSTIRDITERKAAEAALRESEERLRVLLESVHDYAIYTVDLVGNITSWNEGARRLKGYTAEEIIGRLFHCFYTDEDLWAGKPDQEMQTALSVGRSEEESWRVRKDGSLFWGNEIMTPLYAKDGTHLGFTKVTQDLSARKAAEETVRLAEERLRLTLESIHDYAIFTQDVDGFIVEWNKGAERIFGYDADEIVGQYIGILFTPEDRDVGAPAREMQQARRTGRAADERWHLRKDGTRFYASGVLSPLQNNTLQGYVKVARDLTERKLAEEQLQRLRDSLERQVAERTEQVRQLVTQLTLSEQEERRRISSILHDDLQQRLFSLAFQLGVMRDQLDKNEVTEALQLLVEFSTDLRDSITMTRNLSVDLSPPVLHNEGIVEALRWLVTQMQQQFQLAVTVTKEGSWPRLNPSMRILLFQLVRELLFNVVKHAGVTKATVLLAGEKDSLRIVVSDQGTGFDVSALSDTQSQGLSRVRERLLLFGGSLQVESAPGQGTRVTIRVPLDYLSIH